MMTGRITADAEAALWLEIQNPGNDKQQISVEAIIDTGFNGALTLPPERIEALGLPEAGEDQVQLGDGSLITVRTFEAVVFFDERPRRLSVEEALTVPLVGTELLWGYGLRVDFETGGRVEVRALP